MSRKKSKIRISGTGKIGLARKNKKVVAGLFLCVGVLVLVLAYLVLNSFGVFESHSPEFFEVKDECSLIMGNLVHQIRDDGECRIKCVNECDVRSMEFFDFEFEGKDNDCNACDCWCE